MSELTLMPEPAQRVEIFTGAGRRRRWTDADKAAIVAESYAPGDTVCAVARRHGLTPQQVFAWRRQARLGRESSDVPPFVPVVLDLAPAEVPVPPQSSMDHQIELELAGAVVRIGAEASARAITAVIRALKAVP